MTFVKKHTVIQSVILHLLPGLLVGGVYFSFVPLVVKSGYPTIMALILAAVVVLIPFELGVLYVMKKRANDPNYQNIILNREKVSTLTAIFWIVLIIVLSGLAFKLIEPLTNIIQDTVFKFIPVAYHVDFGYSDVYSTKVLLTTYVLGFFVLAIIAPTVEELYFRGYLLPRIPLDTKYSGILHSFLFSLYHVWTPWMFVARTIGFYPFVFVVQKKRNINIVIIAHCLVNMIDFIVGFMFIINL